MPRTVMEPPAAARPKGHQANSERMRQTLFADDTDDGPTSPPSPVRPPEKDWTQDTSWQNRYFSDAGVAGSGKRCAYPKRQDNTGVGRSTAKPDWKTTSGQEMQLDMSLYQKTDRNISKDKQAQDFYGANPLMSAPPKTFHNRPSTAPDAWGDMPPMPYEESPAQRGNESPMGAQRRFERTTCEFTRVEDDRWKKPPITALRPWRMPVGKSKPSTYQPGEVAPRFVKRKTDVHHSYHYPQNMSGFAVHSAASPVYNRSTLLHQREELAITHEQIDRDWCRHGSGYQKFSGDVASAVPTKGGVK